MSCVSWLVDYQWSGQSSANIYEVFFFKNSYFATATAVIINVHFSITCLPLSYSSPSTTLCIITVTHCKSGGGLECVLVCEPWDVCVCVWGWVGVLNVECVLVMKLTNVCFFVRVYAKYAICLCLAFVCMSAWESVGVCACVWVGVSACACWLSEGRVQGGCSVQCPPKAKTCQASILPDGTSWRYSCKPLIMWFDSTRLSITPSVTWPTKSTSHCPPLPPSPAPSVAAHHFSPMWCSPSITYYCHDLLLHADRSGDKYSSTTEAQVYKIWGALSLLKEP